MTMTWWKVYLRGKMIDKVPYDSDCDADYVRRGLIGHDGYDSGIVVRKERKAASKPKRRAGGKARHGRTATGGAKFVTGDGRRFATMDAAVAHANDVARKTGVFISVEDVNVRAAADADALRNSARQGGKARHAGSGRLERSYLRPFATYCGGCHAHLSGKAHAWRVKGTEQYLCNACGGGAGGGKKRHGASGRPYVGHLPGGTKKVFRSASTPTRHSTHGRFTSTTGPFKTVGGARTWATSPTYITQEMAENISRSMRKFGIVVEDVKKLLKK